MSQLKGTNLNAPIVPNDSNDVFATHLAINGQGGLRTVQTLAERDAITLERREWLMEVNVLSDSKKYTLKPGTDLTDNANWIEVVASAGPMVKDWLAGAQAANSLVTYNGNVYRVKFDIANGQAEPATNTQYYQLLADGASLVALQAQIATEKDRMDTLVANTSPALDTLKEIADQIAILPTGRFRGEWSSGVNYSVGDAVTRTVNQIPALYSSTTKATSVAGTEPETGRGWTVGAYLVTSDQASALRLAQATATNRFATIKDVSFPDLNQEITVSPNTFSSASAMRFVGAGTFTTGFAQVASSQYAPRTFGITLLRRPIEEATSAVINVLSYNGNPQATLDGKTSLTLQPGEWKMIGAIAKTNATSVEYKTLLSGGAGGSGSNGSASVVIEQSLSSYSTTAVPSVAAVADVATELYSFAGINFAKRIYLNSGASSTASFVNGAVYGIGDGSSATYNISLPISQLGAGNINSPISFLITMDNNKPGINTLNFTNGVIEGNSTMKLMAGDWLLVGRDKLDGRAPNYQPKSYFNKIFSGNSNQLTSNVFINTDIKDAVRAGTFINGELQGTQPIGSFPNRRFTDAAYQYTFDLSMNDTDGTTYAWIRTAKA
jgi:hypothetical protein